MRTADSPKLATCERSNFTGVCARHDLLDHRRQPRERRRAGCRTVTSRLNSDAALIHPPEVAQAALQQVAVADDDLLAGDAADARRLEPDVLDGSGDLIDADRVADVERFVEHDRERREQVAEDVLHGERDGDAADAESRDPAA